MNKVLKITVISIVFLLTGLFASAFENDDQAYPQEQAKKSTMLNVLEALENGKDYDSNPGWRENEYGFTGMSVALPDFEFDFDFDFPELDFDFLLPEDWLREDFIEDFEIRMELLDERMQKKLDELEKLIEERYKDHSSERKVVII